MHVVWCRDRPGSGYGTESQARHLGSEQQPYEESLPQNWTRVEACSHHLLVEFRHSAGPIWSVPPAEWCLERPGFVACGAQG